MISSRLTTQINSQIADTRAMALGSYMVSLEHAQARQQAPSQPQQPKQGATEKGKPHEQNPVR